MVHHGFQGSHSSLKKQIQNKYGSLAEFCLEFDLAINATCWEKEETAIRVAKKIGSLDRIQVRSQSLFNFLQKEGLIEKIGLPENQVDILIKSILEYACQSESRLYGSIIEQWFLREDNLGVIEDIPDVVAGVLNPSI